MAFMCLAGAEWVQEDEQHGEKHPVARARTHGDEAVAAAVVAATAVDVTAATLAAASLAAAALKYRLGGAQSALLGRKGPDYAAD